MDSELQTAIDDLYRVFAAYHLPAWTDPCRCCKTKADDELLRSRPLRELESEQLSKYAFSALLTWGNETVFKHFLPRIYELMSRPYGPQSLPIDSEILTAKLRLGRWRQWPAEEQRSLERYLHALWRFHLGTDQREFCAEWEELADEWLCAIAQAEDVLQPYLLEWIADDRLTSVEALCSFILRSPIAASGRTVRNGFWEKCDRQYAELRKWIFSDCVKSKLQMAATTAPPELRAETEAALSMLAAEGSERSTQT
jgi:hypothetical protein